MYQKKLGVRTEVKEKNHDDNKVMKHEAQHVKVMQSGREGCGDDWVRWEGKTFARKNGKIKYNGTWKEEGDRSFPWEKSANKK